MDPSFGARLRLQREQQQVALTAIAEQTKIKLSLLEGLERDDLSHWPGGIFRRSYVRTYAHAIGLDPDTVLREFLEHYPEAVEEIPDLVAARNGGEFPGRRPPTRLRFLIGSAIGALPTLRAQSAPRSEPVTGQVAATNDDSPLGRVALYRHDELSVEPAAEATTADDLWDEDEHLAVHGAGDSSAGEPANEPAAEGEASAGRLPFRIDLPAVAQLCTRLGRVLDAREVVPVLADAARMLHAVGLILWMWDPRGGALRPVLAHGYSDELLAQLPRVGRDTDNAIAAAFRSAATHVVDGNDLGTGAVATPLLTPAGCAGVLALELRDGGERHECVRAMAAILAAQLSTLIECPPLAQAASA